MINLISTLRELMLMTSFNENREYVSKDDYIHSSTVDSAQRKRYIRSLKKDEVALPNLPKTIRHKWINKKDAIAKFIKDLDYNNHIQSSYELTLIESQSKRNEKDVA
tara:strand:- start:3912 stop:4232 length:321 start_codon:yes stop_codon:yes gene_type:complete